MMKDQMIETVKGERFILFGDDYKPVDEVKRFLKFCDAFGKSSNTLISYATDLKTFYVYMNNVGIPIKNLCSAEGKGPIEILKNAFISVDGDDIPSNS